VQQLLAKANRHDPDLRSGYAAADEVTVVGQEATAATGDTYTLTLNFTTVAGGTVVTTAAIAYNANAATIEGAIDTAMTAASFPSWTNADISVSGGALDAADITLTFDGTSVDSLPCVVSLTATGFTYAGAITRSTPGSVGRPAAQAIADLNVAVGTWGSGDATVTLTKPAASGQTRPRKDLLRALALITIEEDGTETAFDALAALYPEILEP
jgi:hypothetical protein